MIGKWHSSTLTNLNKQLRMLVVLGMLFGMLAPLAQPATTYAASEILLASWSGGAGTYKDTTSGILYAKTGGTLNLTVTTNNDVKCVEVIEGTVTTTQTSDAAKTTWTFPFTAGSVDGVKNLTINARPMFNNSGKCPPANGIADKETTTTSYVVDNAGPVVTGTLKPEPNAAGWNNSDVTITWSATDTGSGVASGPSPASDSVIANTAGVTKTASATDNLGNIGSGSVAVKLDETLPTITGSRSPAANTYGWNNTDVTASFTCSDGLSGIKSCTADGTSPAGASKTLSGNGANQSVSGTAVDNADNRNTANVGDINIDKVTPTLSGAPTTSPNGAGWYNTDVTIAWSPNDNLSGIVAAPANSTISSEGTALTASASVSDKAGNSSGVVSSSPAVKIDKTAPNTTATAPTNWNNVNVTVSLSANDALSGVAATRYSLDGAPEQTGTSVSISSEGVHTLSFYSVDVAGNSETAKTVQVKIDKTPPTINHTQSPAANNNGWNNVNVTVTFTCADVNGSGIASCTAPQTVTTEGRDQTVTGTATDNAGNTATDPARVSIDKTAPTISAAADRSPNDNLAANGKGWYKDDVSVSFACDDALSGMASCPAQQRLGEGANQSASGTATDAAGNTASATVSGINVDKTAPELTGTPSTTGWSRSDVTVTWACSDTLSSIAGSCPAASTVTGEGDNLSTSTSVSDLAGNSKTTTVGGIKIDRTAPSTSASVPAPLESGWYAGAVRVTLTGVDSLSGVDKTYYSVDGGSAQEYTSAFNHNLGGEHTITFWSVDVAGNVEDKTAPGHSITLKIDNVVPTITGSRTAANGFGWNNGSVVVSFACSDAESGIAGCVGDTTVSNEGAGQSVPGTATDNAGNTNSATVRDINIDLTKPTLTGTPTTDDNAAGWYKGDVTIAWTGSDGLSGIDPASVPPNSTISGEGRDLKAGSATVTDKAGNVSDPTYSAMVNIDRTAPTISGATVNEDGTARSANAAGWFNSAVRVRFTCSDTLSGVQECASDVVKSTDGANQSASGTGTDRADNSASATVSGINIDSQAPKSEADISCTSKNGWCRGQTAMVNLTAGDQTGLSSVKEIRYSVNGGPWQTATGASVSVNVPLEAKSGQATVEFYAVDNAGNSETKNSVSLKYDNIAPTVSHALNPAANAAGWNKADTTVTFSATDDSDGSGVDAATLTAPVTVATETAVEGQVVNGEAHDLAGNKGTDSVTVKLDETAPTISGAATTSANANGWYNGSVTVKFTCSDALSGIATCPADQVLNSDGANQNASGTATDKAGNSTSATVSGINIDSVKPTIDSVSVTNGATYILGAVPAATCEATDTDSGLDGACSVTLDSSKANANGTGTFSFTATAKDLAGNIQTVTGSYTVIYNIQYGTAFFLQPINDTAHMTGLTTSVFKAGSTVPVKFQLKDANGNVVQASSAPLWLTPAKGSATSEPVSESAYSDPATTGTTYRWDGQQYIYNWGSPKNGAGYYWRVGVKLDDGRMYAVNIGLR